MGYFVKLNVVTTSDIWAGCCDSDARSYEKVEGPLLVPRRENIYFQAELWLRGENESVCMNVTFLHN